jgi:hypothetical protein
MTFIFPALIMLVLLNIRTIRSLRLSERTERRYPYAIISIVYITAYYIMINFPPGIPNPVSNFILTAAVVIFTVMLINFKIKLSAHMAGFGGFIGFFYIFFLKENVGYILFTFLGLHVTPMYFLIFMILLAGIIASSRLSLNAHNPLQVLLGFLTGLAIGILNIFLS